jgi:hypothetical protein
VRHYHHTRYAPPVHVHYRPYYTRWYCHPWYRYQHSTTVVVGFGFATYAWHDYWAPPTRAGWAWVPGYWSYGYWHPGYWAPIAPAPVNYVYVPGSWDAEVYVEGYYRTESRDGWDWVDGYYLEDGTFIRGHWMPLDEPAAGYVWEPGFYDGEAWVEGFWRPEFRQDFVWVGGYFDTDGIFHSGYWLPLVDEDGLEWIPGWFDGNAWNPGYWVEDTEFDSADLDNWEPDDGWDDGWEVGAGWGSGEVLENQTYAPDALEDMPLAMPVPVD